jgi:hypothetical protein
MEISITERCTDMAAALGTLGAVITPERVADASSGEKKHYFKVTGACGKIPAAKVRADYRNGKLPMGHLLRRFFLGFRNRTVLLEWLEKGGGLHSVKGDDGWELVRGDRALPGLTYGAAVFKTQNLKNAVAYISAGYDLLKVEGSWGSFVFYVEARGPEGFAPDMITRWRTHPDSFTNDSIFAAVLQSLVNREKLISLIPDGYGRVLVRRPGTQRQVVLPEAASKKGWDAARRFLLG